MDRVAVAVVGKVVAGAVGKVVDRVDKVAAARAAAPNQVVAAEPNQAEEASNRPLRLQRQVIPRSLPKNCNPSHSVRIFALRTTPRFWRSSLIPRFYQRRKS